MNEQQGFWSFILQQSDELLEQTLAHIGLTFISLLLSVIIGIPLGIWISNKQKYSGWVLGFAGILQTIPSIALLGFMIPLLGIGVKPAIVALMLYAFLPIIRNTYTGITQVDASVIDAAKGMGMSSFQILSRVKLPLAMPVIFAGIRTATVINVGVATLAAYIGAGGLGTFIFRGISLNNTNTILAGAIPAAFLAILFDFLLSLAQKLNIKKVRIIMWSIPLIAIILLSVYLLPGTPKSKILAGFTPEFMGRTDGYLGLKDKYGFNIKPVVVNDAVMYKAAFEKQLDVVSGYSTDGRLKAFDLVVLKDDKIIFPPYYAAPIVRNNVLQKFPELEPTLNILAGKINDSMMTYLNYRVDHLKQSPKKVAKDFLTQLNLYKEPRNGNKGIIRMGSKIFGEQYILVEIYGMLIKGNTDLNVETKSTGLGGTEICFGALNNNQIDLYPEYTGTGLLVILHSDSSTVNKVINDKDKVFEYVQQEFNNRYKVKWLKPIGFNNAYALMMRREQAENLKIKTISELQMYIDNK
jgi:osmoprotectant transport system permease protein